MDTSVSSFSKKEVVEFYDTYRSELPQSISPPTLAEYLAGNFRWSECRQGWIELEDPKFTDPHSAKTHCPFAHAIGLSPTLLSDQVRAPGTKVEQTRPGGQYDE